MDMFKLGQMLGNAYGNLWVANANKRDDKKIEDIKNNLNKPEAQNEIAELGPTVGTLDPNTSIEDVNQAISQNAAISGGPQGITYNKNAGIVGNVPQRANNINPSDVVAGGGIVGLDGSENTGIAWKPRFSAEDLDKAMKERGIGQGSRDRALAQYAKETAQQAQKEMLPALLERMGQENPRGAFADVLRYAQYDPTMRDVVMKDYEKALAFDNQRKLEAQRLADKMAYAEVYGGRGGRSSGSGRRTGRGGSADEEYYGSTGFNVNLDKRLKVLDGNIARIDKMLKYENLSPERRAKLETDLQRYQEEGIAIMDGTWAQQYGPSEEELLLSNPLDASNPKSVDAWSRFIQSKGDRATMSEVMGKMLGEDSDEYKRIMKNSAADYDPTDAYIGIEDVPNSSGSKESSKSESKKETPLTGKSLGKANWVSTDGNSTIFDIVDDRYNPDGTRRKYPWQR